VIGGLSAVVAKGQTLPILAKWCFATALIFLLVGALSGLAVAFPVLAPSVKVDQLRAAVDDETWSASADAQLARASRARAAMIAHTRPINNTKAIVLRWGVLSSGLGIVLLVAAVLVLLTHP